MRGIVLGRLAPAVVGVLLVVSCSSGDSDETTATDESTTSVADEPDDSAESDDPAEGAHAADGHGSTPAWSYDEDAADGPANWSTLHPDGDWEACDGQHQSPIDIDTSEVVEASDEDLPDIVFDYDESPLTIFNNGHTIQATYGGDSTIVLDDTTYRLVQFHFHADSEHEVDGDAAPLEVHFVHSEVLPEGATAAPRLAVIGVLIDEGTANGAYDAIVSHIPTTVLHDPAEIAAVEPIPDVTIDAAAMLPDDLAFFHYTGSLTTPDCGEGVSWQVLTTRIEMSSEQVQTIASEFSPHGNSRPLQERGDRDVRVSG